MIDKNKIPAHWEIKILGDVCEKIPLNGIKIKQRDYLLKGKYPVIDQGQELVGGYYNDSSLLVPKEPPFIIFGDHTKVKKYVTFKFIAGADGVKVLKPNKLYNPKFFYYLIQNVEIPDKGYARHFQFLEKSEIPLPPLNEQEAILAKIEELLSDLENGKQQLLTAQAQLKVYRQSLLKWAFEGKLTNKDIKEGELPEGWKWGVMGDILTKIDAGKSFKCDERVPNDNEVGVLKVSAVTWQVYNENESKTILEDNRYNPNFLVNKNDFLFSRANTIDLVGAAVIVSNVTKKLMLSDKTLRFHFKDVIVNYYILHYLRSKKGKLEIQRLSTGNQESMRNIGQERIKQIIIPIAPIEEQKRIASEFESKLTVCDKLEETISQSLIQADTLKQSILKKAFEGKLLANQEIETNITQPVPIDVPRVINGISPIDLHAGIIAMVITAHEKAPQHITKLNHVKGEKIAHLVEYKLGISLGRNPVKDAAGPDDYNHLKKVEHRANMANWFGIRNLAIGHTYYSKPGSGMIINKVETSLSKEEWADINNLIVTFLPSTMEQIEIVATLFAGWNNLLLEGKSPSDEEIVYESRENWSERKLKIDRERFFKALQWMKTNNYIPDGRGDMVLKSEKTINKKKK